MIENIKELKEVSLKIIKEVEKSLEKKELEQLILNAKECFDDLKKEEDIYDLVFQIMLYGIKTGQENHDIYCAMYPILKEQARIEGWEKE
jgi:hypothetical protein